MSKILYNFWYKIASFVIALLIWVLVQGSENIEKSVMVNVIVDVPEEYIVKDGNEKHISATIYGPSAIVEKTQNSDLRAKIKLKDVETGSTEIEVDTTDIDNLDTRLKVNIKNPSINLFIDKKISKLLPIKEVLQGTLPAGYKMGGVGVEPKNLVVVGAKTDVDKLQYIQTEPIDISGLEKPTVKNVFLVRSPSASTIYSLKKVEVSLNVITNAASKLIKSVPIHVQSATFRQDDVEIEPQTVDVEIETTTNRIEELKPEQVLNAVVELSGTQFDASEKEVRVYPLIDNLEVLRITPSKVLVRMKK